MDLIQENTYRQPEQFIDPESGFIRNKWEDATPADLFAVKERMYHQARRPNETFDGRHWAAIFKSHGLAMVSRVNMELYQNQYNVLFDYTKMRSFLNDEFGIEVPLPRHEKIEYPYEEHNEAFERANLLNSKPDGLDPETLGDQYDPNAPENKDDIERAIANAERLLRETDLEKAEAEQRAGRLKSDMEELDTLIALDTSFESICKSKDIDPHQYALYKYSSRPGPQAMSFDEAVSDLMLTDKGLVEHFTTKTENEFKGISEPASSAINDESNSKRALNAEIDEAGTLGEDPSIVKAPEGEMENGHADISQENSNRRSEDTLKTDDGLNQYMQQIALQSKTAQEPKDPDQKREKEKDKERKSEQPGGTSITLAMPFVPRIGAITSGIVSYPTKKFREYRDTSVHKNKVAESRLNLLSTIKDVGENFSSYSPDQKLSAAKKLNESVENYRDDIESANGHANGTNDRRLKDFLREEKKSHVDVIKNGIDKYIKPHKELEALAKHLNTMMDMIKNLLRSISRVIFGKPNSAPSSSPSP